MSNASNVPPTLGTEPLTGDARLRRYREEPGIYQRYREEGSHPYTLDEIDARIVACAADEATRQTVDPLRPALFRELEGIFWHRLYRDMPDSRERMASHEKARALGLARREAAEENTERFERQRRELESRRMRMVRPITGMTLTRDWFLYACLAPAALIEIIGSTPSVQEAFKLDIGWSVLFAVAISAVLVLTAEQLGSSLASWGARSRRRAGIVAGLLLVAVILAGVVTILSLAKSRETNLSFREAVQASREVKDESGHIGGAAKSPAAGAPVAASANAPTKPDFTFFIPLSILVLGSSTLVALRVEAARPYNRLDDEVRRVTATVQGQRDVVEEETEALVEANGPDNEILLELAAYVEQERNLLDVWIARFEAEYGRFCLVAGRTPRNVEVPNVPDAGEILLRILHPDGNRLVVEPERAPAGDFMHEATAEQGDPGPGNGEGGGAEPEPPPPPGPEVDPEPEPETFETNERSGPPPRTSFDASGRPRWMGGF